MSTSLSRDLLIGNFVGTGLVTVSGKVSIRVSEAGLRFLGMIHPASEDPNQHFGVREWCHLDANQAFEMVDRYITTYFERQKRGRLRRHVMSESASTLDTDLGEFILGRLAAGVHDRLPWQIGGVAEDDLSTHLTTLLETGNVDRRTLTSAFDAALHVALDVRPADVAVVSGLCFLATCMGVPLDADRLVRFVEAVEADPAVTGGLDGVQMVLRTLGRQARWDGDVVFWERHATSGSYGARTIAVQGLAWIDPATILDRLPGMDVNAPLVVRDVMRRCGSLEAFDRMLGSGGRGDGRRRYAVEMLTLCGEAEAVAALGAADGFPPRPAGSGDDARP